MMLIGSLREVIRAQAEEIDTLKTKLQELSSGIADVSAHSLIHLRNAPNCSLSLWCLTGERT